MKTINIMLFLLILVSSCKNNSEKEAVKEVAEIEPAETEVISETYEPMVDNVEEELEEPEEQPPSEASIFDINQSYVYVAKADLDEKDLALYEDLTSVKSNGNEQAMVTDNGKEFYVKLQEVKTYFSDDKERLNDLKNSIERNVTHASISKGFETDGKTKIRELVNDHTGSFIEDLLGAYLLKGRLAAQTTLRRLGVASQENIVSILCDFMEITEAELELIKSFPQTEKLLHSNMAKDALDFEIPVEVTEHLNSVDCTDGFKAVIAKFKERQTKEPNRFMQKAAQAKDDFYKLNPGWYGEDEEIGNTYVDARKKYIYLPFGSLSFADKVISHELGSNPGSNSNGTLGEPDMVLENFRTADPRIGNLGINGVLTLEFSDNTLSNVNGPDLYVFEMGKIEPTKLEISKDGISWIDIGRIEGGTAMVDIGEFVKPGETFNYVRLTDLDTFSTLPGADVDAVATIGGALRLNLDSAVLFDTGKFKLKESAASELEALAIAVAEIPKGTIIVEGHTDNVGSPESNKTLSRQRATEVATYLKSKLADSYIYKIQGFGESQPVAPNDSEENKQKNRRVEILVVPSK